VKRSIEIKKPKTPVARIISEIKNSEAIFHFPGGKYACKNDKTSKGNSSLQKYVNTKCIVDISDGNQTASYMNNMVAVFLRSF